MKQLTYLNYRSFLSIRPTNLAHVVLFAITEITVLFCWLKLVMLFQRSSSSLYLRKEIIQIWMLSTFFRFSNLFGSGKGFQGKQISYFSRCSVL